MSDTEYTVKDTSATVHLGPVTIKPVYVLTGPYGVVAYGLKWKLDDLAEKLNRVAA